ncbi:hypothetical protein OV090_08840 [Nannocystis sp. RBIL2]|nr:hypothetical protein [Nannocystis sp. RBIL2]MCY1064863.1 hypothetical protein [Nannocystis sp. RBIL2]
MSNASGTKLAAARASRRVRSDGGDPGAGRFLLFVLGLALALVKRRS